jgi:hypothetical protein
MLKRLFALLFLLPLGLMAQKPRLIVTTDVGQDPDDEQSMVRLLHYANEFDIEAIIANADANADYEPAELKGFIIHDMINAYAKIEDNLRKHDAAYPTAWQLHGVVKRGCYGNAESIPYTDFIGEGKDTEGSDWLIKVVDKDDPRPINIAVWGGACDLAQALWKVRNTRSEKDVNQFVEKLRVYFIGMQDSSNDWVIENFPRMWMILALDKGGDKWQSGYRGMFWGGNMNTTSKSWLHENIIGVNPLASMYPDKASTGGSNKNPYMAMKEGDSPSMLFFIRNGLNNSDEPSWGGWGGRYELERDNYYRDANDLFYDEQSGREIQSPRATVFRWRSDFQQDFACRVRWATQNYEQGNHYPQLAVNGEKGIAPLYLRTNAGKIMSLHATGSVDPDGDELVYHWVVYPEAGTYNGNVEVKDADLSRATIQIPKNAKGKTIHVILCVKDKRALSLTSYRRIVILIA